MTTNFRIHYASLPGVLPLLSQGLLFTADWLQSRTLLARMKTGSPKCGGPHKHSKKTTPIRLDLDLGQKGVCRWCQMQQPKFKNLSP